jgi:hypothetical protein
LSIDLTKPGPPTLAPRPSDARLRRRSRSAVARSAAGDRWLVALIGLVLLAVGIGVALLSFGVFGTPRAGRPLLDPIMVATVAADASRRAALLVAYILPVCALLAPCRAGASTPKLTILFRPGPFSRCSGAGHSMVSNSVGV